MSKFVTHLMVCDDTTLVTLTNMPNDIAAIAQVFQEVAKAGINVDMICQTPPYKDVQDLSFSIGDEDLPKALSVTAALQKQFPHVKTDVNAGNTKLSFFGEAMREQPGVAADIFSVLAQNGIAVKLITTSERHVSVLIDAQDVDPAMTAAKEAFGL